MNSHDLNIFQIIRRGSYDEFINILNIQTINTLFNEDKKNLLMVAIENNKYDIAELLVQKGSDLNYQDKEGNSCLHLVAKLYTDTKYAELLLSHNCRLDIENKYGNEPLWDAVFNASKMINDGKNDLVSFLIKHGANSLHKNHNDKSPIDFANKINDEIIIKILNNQI